MGTCSMSAPKRALDDACFESVVKSVPGAPLVCGYCVTRLNHRKPFPMRCKECGAWTHTKLGANGTLFIVTQRDHSVTAHADARRFRCFFL